MKGYLFLFFIVVCIMASLCCPFVYSMFSHAHKAVFGNHLVLVTTARWRTHACCKITVSQPWRKYSCVAFCEAAGAKFCDNATAWTALHVWWESFCNLYSLFNSNWQVSFNSILQLTSTNNQSTAILHAVSF